MNSKHQSTSGGSHMGKSCSHATWAWSSLGNPTRCQLCVRGSSSSIGTTADCVWNHARKGHDANPDRMFRIYWPGIKTHCIVSLLASVSCILPGLARCKMLSVLLRESCLFSDLPRRGNGKKLLGRTGIGFFFFLVSFLGLVVECCT